MTDPFYVYKLEWEMPWSQEVAALENERGRHFWQTANWDELDLHWYTQSVMFFKKEERLAQFRQLKLWQESREQPVKNVRLLQRLVVISQPDWEEIGNLPEATTASLEV